MSLQVGDHLGPYEILGPIGAGGMGEVYRARDPKLNRTVAIKVLPSALSTDAGYMARFQREAQALAALNHPNIAAIYGLEDGAIVMELVEGPTLADRIAQDALPLDESLEIAKQIAEALEAAHEQGIVHRDLKPANIKIRPDGTVKVLDFGLAKMTDTPGPSLPPENSPTLTLDAAATRIGVILGTAAYMAPEQVRGIPADKRADIWAFGVVLYEILTRRRLFRGETAADILASVLKTKPDWNTLPPDIPTPIRRLLRRCLEHERKRRLPDIGVARLEIDEARAEPAELTAVAKPKRRSWIAIGVVIALAAGAGWTVSRLLTPASKESVLRFELEPPEAGQFVFGLGLVPGGISISPDGRTAAYIVSSGGKIGLWVRSLQYGGQRLLAGTEGASSPFWSPDSKELAYFVDGALERLDLTGGPPFKICDIGSGGFSGGTWSDDGSILIASAGQPLFRVPASGGTPVALRTPVTYGGYPQALPGGRFLYFDAGRDPQESGVYAASIAKPEQRTRLLSTDTNAIYAPGGDGKIYLLFLRGSTLLAQEFDPRNFQLRDAPFPLADGVDRLTSVHRMNVAASGTGIVLYGASQNLTQFRWLDRGGRTLGKVGQAAEFTSFRLSRDARKLAVSRILPSGGDIRIFELDRGIDSRFSSKPASYPYPLWSPDGQRLVFSFGNPPKMFEQSLNKAENAARVTRSEKPAFELSNDWSPDGRYIMYFEALPDTNEDLWYVAVSPDTGTATAEPQLWLRTPAHEFNGRFSPDADAAGARWVAYQSDESGRFEIYADLFPKPGHKVQISTAGGQFPEWGPAAGRNGRELFYVSPDYRLMAVTLQFGPASITPSTPRELFALPATASAWTPFEATLDGQRFLVRATPETVAPSPLRAIMKWPELGMRAADKQ